MQKERTEAQLVLDELLKEGLLPFALTVGDMIDEGSSVYKVRFHDSRIRSVEFSFHEGESFAEIFRAAVLERVSKMSGPLSKPG